MKQWLLKKNYFNFWCTDTSTLSYSFEFKHHAACSVCHCFDYFYFDNRNHYHSNRHSNHHHYHHYHYRDAVVAWTAVGSCWFSWFVCLSCILSAAWCSWLLSKVPPISITSYLSLSLHIYIFLYVHCVCKGARGVEMVPNLSFWQDFPSLVKDGRVSIVSFFLFLFSFLLI